MCPQEDTGWLGLFCKSALWTRRYFAKETCDLIDPTDRSHPIWRNRVTKWMRIHIHIHLYMWQDFFIGVVLIHIMWLVPQKSHKLQGSFAENDL